MITPKGVGDFQVGGMTPTLRSATADYSTKHNRSLGLSLRQPARGWSDGQLPLYDHKRLRLIATFSRLLTTSAADESGPKKRKIDSNSFEKEPWRTVFVIFQYWTSSCRHIYSNFRITGVQPHVRRVCRIGFRSRQKCLWCKNNALVDKSNEIAIYVVALTKIDEDNII